MKKTDDEVFNEDSSKEIKKKGFFRRHSYGIFLICEVLAIIVLFKVVLINATIPSESMQNTIMKGDRIIGNRLAYLFSDPERFDIIIFPAPDSGKLFIKRIIGMPGETVEVKDGVIYIDGTAHPECNDFCPETPHGSSGPYTVPDDCYFMMGDNRNNSSDSRAWRNHFVPKDTIVAKAIFRYWPLSGIGTVD